MTRLKTQLEQERYTFVIIAFDLTFKLLNSFLVCHKFNLVSQVHYLSNTFPNFFSTIDSTITTPFPILKKSLFVKLMFKSFQVETQSSLDLTDLWNVHQIWWFLSTNFIGQAELWENKGFIQDGSSDTVHHNIWRKSKLSLPFQFRVRLLPGTVWVSPSCGPTHTSDTLPLRPPRCLREQK